MYSEQVSIPQGSVMLDFAATSRSIEIEGSLIHYNDVGQGEILFTFHGGGPGANAWDNTKWNLEALAQRFRVILMDLPGYGGSHHVEALDDESLESMHARVIGAFMDKLAIHRAHFYGTSMSAGSVIVFAHKHPDRVSRIVLKTPSVGPNLLSPTPPDGIMALLAFAEDPTRANMDRMMRLFVPKPGLLTEQMIEDRFNSAIAARGFPPPKKATTGFGDFRSLLPGLTSPILVLWGHQDRMVPLEGALTVLALIPNVQIHLWGGGTGHFIEFEHTEDFNELVIGFISKDRQP